MKSVNFVKLILFFFINHVKNLGLNVKVFVRDENKVPMNLKNKIEIIIGDVTNKEQVSNAISNTDAVVVVLGTRNDLSKYLFLNTKYYNIIIFFDLMSSIFIANFYLGPTTILSTGMKNIIDAMKMHNVEVVSVCLSGKFL